MSGSLISSEIAEPYAQALMSLARQNDLTDQFGDTFRALEELFAESEEFRDFIANPIIDAAAKKSVLKRVMGKKLTPI